MKRFSTALILILLSSTFLFAEKVVITLNDGTKVIGEKLGEDDLSITVNAPNAAGITEDRKFEKETIKNVRPWGPHDRDIEQILTMVPTPDLLPKNVYEDRIEACKRFLDIHKASAPAEQLEAVTKILATLEEELARVENGDVKFGGNWIEKSEREANEYEIDMQIGIARMKELADAGNHRLAMQTFDVIQRDFVNSEHYEEARQLALEILENYKRAVAAMLQNVDAKIDLREKSLAGLAPSERDAEQAAIKRLDDRYQQLLDADKASKTKWLVLNEYQKKPMQDVLRSIDQAIRSLQRPAPADARTVGPIFREVWAAIRAGDRDTAKDLYSDLRPLRVPERYMTKMDAQINPPESETEPEAKPETTTEEPDPDAAAEAEAQKKKEEEEREKARRARQSQTPPPSAPAEEKKGFPIQIVLVVVLVLVVAGALVAAFAGKKR